MMLNMNETGRERGWCSHCEHLNYPAAEYPDEFWCPECGETMKSLDSLTKAEAEQARFFEWMEDVHESGKWGPSPGGACAELRCDRSMIDKLAERGILEKSVYDRDGHHIVMISRRSIEKARENKELRGKWTDPGEEEES